MVNKVLVIDDSATERTNLESILSGAGYTVSTANDGNDAVSAAKNSHPDVILMDVNMPGKDGFAATRDLKNDAETKEIPVVFVTSKNQKADMAWGQMLGAKGYITKPFSEEQILSQVKMI